MLDGLSLYKTFTRLLSQLIYFEILGSTIYVFIHEEKKKTKSAKWKPQAKHGLLIDYNGHFIYWICLEKDAKVIYIKDLKSFKDVSTKTETSLPNKTPLHIQKICLYSFNQY